MVPGAVDAATSDTAVVPGAVVQPGAVFVPSGSTVAPGTVAGSLAEVPGAISPAVGSAVPQWWLEPSSSRPAAVFAVGGNLALMPGATTSSEVPSAPVAFSFFRAAGDTEEVPGAVAVASRGAAMR